MQHIALKGLQTETKKVHVSSSLISSPTPYSWLISAFTNKQMTKNKAEMMKHFSTMDALPVVISERKANGMTF